jgi:tRNA pseudouridine55 synthase
MGHAGTLDPMATGVLVVCIGKATRLIPYVQRMRKEYQATMRLGQRSATHDLESELQPVPEVQPLPLDSFETCLARFRGSLLQVPPQHSAIHVAGRRAYERARAGETVALEPRPVCISRFNCTRFEFPDADVEIECSSGTYIRSLVRDIGEELGCGAVMTRLVRTRIGGFRISDAVRCDGLVRSRVIDSILPAAAAVQELPSVHVPPERTEDVRRGRPIELSAFTQPLVATKECVLTDAAGRVLAVAEIDSAARTVHPRIVLIDD